MDIKEVVQAWDRTLREADWDAARSMLTDEAKYFGTPDAPTGTTCETPDDIIENMRRWKGESPDPEVVA